MRHERVLTESIEGAVGIPVLGSIRKLPLENFPQRHLGLLPLYEHSAADPFVNEAADLISASLDVDKIIEIAGRAGPLDLPTRALPGRPLPRVRIGVLKDSAFQFYYPENLEALENHGAELVFASPLTGQWPQDLDGLYIGGGFPETHAQLLASNTGFQDAVRNAAESGMPIYAECGGLMYSHGPSRSTRRPIRWWGSFPLMRSWSALPKGTDIFRWKQRRTIPFILKVR